MLVDAVDEGTGFPLLNVLLDMIIQTFEVPESLVFSADSAEVLTLARIQHFSFLKVGAVLDVIVELHGLFHIRVPGPVQHPLAPRGETEKGAEIRGPGDQRLGLPGRHLVLEVHVLQSLGIGVEDGGAVTALKTVLSVLLFNMSLQVSNVEVLVTVTALDLVSTRGRLLRRRPGPEAGGHVSVPESDLREGEDLRTGATLPLVAVIDAGVHGGVSLPVLPQHGLTRVSVPGSGAIFAGDLPQVRGENGECHEAIRVIGHIVLPDQVLVEVVQLIKLTSTPLTLELVTRHWLSHH